MHLKGLERAPSPGGTDQPEDRDRTQRRPPEIGLHIADQAALQPAGAPRDGEHAGGKGEENAVKHGPDLFPRPEGSRPREEDGTGADMPTVKRYAQPPTVALLPAAYPLAHLCATGVTDVGGFAAPDDQGRGSARTADAVHPDFPGEKCPQRRPDEPGREKR